MNAGKLLTNFCVFAAFAMGLAAAGLWFWSASVNIPVPTFDGLGPHGDFVEALNWSARLNKWAAFTTGLSVLFAAFAQGLQGRR